MKVHDWNDSKGPPGAITPKTRRNPVNSILVFAVFIAIGLAVLGNARLGPIVDSNQKSISQLKEQNAKIQRQQVALRALTLRVAIIDRPTPAQFREGLLRALRRCIADSECRLLFGRLQAQAQIAYQAAQQVEGIASSGTAATPGTSANAPSSQGAQGNQQPTPGLVMVPLPTGPHRSHSPAQSGSGGSSSTPPPQQPPPVSLPLPVPVHVCTPLLGVNC